MAPTVAQAWTAAVVRSADRRFLYHEGREWTYREFDEAARALAERLTVLGIGRRTHVAVVLDNCAEHLLLLLALSLTGSVSVPVNCAGSADDIGYVIEHSRAEWVVSDPGRMPQLRAEVVPATAGTAVLTAEGLHDVVPPARPPHAPRVGAVDAQVGGDDPWSIVYTSGSTGRPRGVVIPQRAFAVTGAAIVEHYGYRRDDTVLCVLPLYHLSATVMGWACVVAAEAAFALAPRFSRSGFWPLADASGATVTLTVPTVVEMLLTEPPSPADRSHPLRLLITHRPYPAFTERFGVEVACLWGMTETSGMGLGTRPGATSAAPGLIGTPYPPDAEVRLLDPTGKPVPRGTPGELFFRHPAVMLGYFREGTSSYGSPGQPVRSGDLALQDDEGNYHYVGRLKNMIKRGGENVSGEEVERHIAGHPQVAEVVVVPVPDPVYVEEVCAVVYPLGTPAPGELADSLVAWCATRLPDWKTPRYFVVRDEPIPKLGNQKFDRKTLMAQMAGAALIDRRADAGMPAASDQSLRPQDHRVAAVPARNQGVRT